MTKAVKRPVKKTEVKKEDSNVSTNINTINYTDHRYIDFIESAHLYNNTLRINLATLTPSVRDVNVTGTQLILPVNCVDQLLDVLMRLKHSQQAAEEAKTSEATEG